MTTQYDVIREQGNKMLADLRKMLRNVDDLPTLLGGTRYLKSSILRARDAIEIVLIDNWAHEKQNRRASGD